MALRRVEGNSVGKQVLIDGVRMFQDVGRQRRRAL
jgi:hypothetical protein